MKKILFAFILLASLSGYSQDIRFNDELDKFCRQTKKDFSSISLERKAMLSSIAEQLTVKKYIGFTCYTNSRRTMLLQTWAQTAFLFYGLNQKFAFSIGDVASDVYPEVVNVLQLSGFYYTAMEETKPTGYVIYVGKDIPLEYMQSKTDFGTIDKETTVVVNVCTSGEKSNIAASFPNIELGYQSPTVFEKTPLEKQKYEELNRQIATEMLYLAKKTKDLLKAQEAVEE